MTKQTGLWIDHKRAVILTLNGRNESLQVVESGVGRHISYRGVNRSRMPYSTQYQKGDDQLDNQFNGHLNKYYEKVLVQLRDADAVWIFGPGEAKSELEKRLTRRRSQVQIDGVESADKMTDRQIAAKVRRHFQQAGAKNRNI